MESLAFILQIFLIWYDAPYCEKTEVLEIWHFGMELAPIWQTVRLVQIDLWHTRVVYLYTKYLREAE